MSKRLRIILLLVASLLIFLSLNRHSKSEVYTYHSEIWADKAGYYVYLPWSVIYSLDASKMPDGISELTGNGFKIQAGKMQTKYTYGVALLQLPFFLIAHIYSIIYDNEASGFTLVYNRLISVAGAIYLFVGLLFLYKILRRRFNSLISILTLSITLLGTNLFYYGIIETGMSHIYSFACFAGLVWLLDTTDPGKKSRLLFISFLIALILVIRPINALFVLFLLLVFRDQVGNLSKAITHSSMKVLIPLCCLIIGMIFLPQLLYWKYSYGSWLYYSYQGEGFNTPQILKFLFSTNNGMILYNPIWIIILYSLSKFAIIGNRLSKFLLIYLVVMCLIFASWWSWNYGCGYGNRSLTEYFVLFSIPIGWIVKSSLPVRQHKVFWIAIALIVSLNLKSIFSYDNCWYYGTWDYDEYFKLIFGPTR